MNVDPNKVKAVFLEAVEKHPSDAWDSFLREACDDNVDLRRQVEILLAAHKRAGAYLEQGAIAGGPTLEQQVAEKPGTQIGPYKLLQQIGEGGMGTVYMAEQTQPVQRKVALKLIKPGMDSRQVIARFEAERQALAIMDHVNIARVLDAGTTEQGRPYFVMELIHGVPITKYCDDNRLTPRQRLELFVPVCQAIQHAHQKGIIHRDIKPSNVMVTLYDGKPVPKVIDFGVAKATEQKLTERTLFTQYGTMVGTLEYMSPEQAEMSALGVDTRSDIYSLGVLLYELLTGSTPLSSKRMKEAAYAEILRLIKEEEPPKPSTRLSDSGEALASISAQRHTEPAKLSKLMRGELDWIVMKTLEKDRNRRYETANGFAADVLRYLNDEPVLACPPSTAYRLRKFARRNKSLLATTTVLALALILGTGVSTWQAIRATNAEERASANYRTANEQRQTAETQRQRAQVSEQDAKTKEAIAQDARKDAVESLNEALDAVDQMLTRVGQDRLANVPQMQPVRRELLEDALSFYQRFLQKNNDDPAIRRGTARAYLRLAEIHRQLGQYKESEIGFRKTFAMFDELNVQSRIDPSTRGELIHAHLQFAETVRQLGNTEEGEKHIRLAVEIAEQLAAEFPSEPGHADRLVDASFHLATLITATQPVEAEKILRRCLTLTDTPHLHGYVHSCLGRLLNGQGRSAEAEQAFRSALELYEKLSLDDPFTNWVQHRLGDTLQEMFILAAAGERLQEAGTFIARAINILDKLATNYPAGPEYRNSQAASHHRRASLLKKLNRMAEAEQDYRQALDICEKLAAEFPLINSYPQNACDQRLNFGQFLVESGRTEEALDVYRQAIDLSGKLAADVPTNLNHWNGLVRTHVARGGLLKGTGKTSEAEAAYREAIAIPEKLQSQFSKEPEYRLDLARSHISTAQILLAAGLYQEADKLYEWGFGLFDTLIADAPDAVEYRLELLRLQLFNWGNPLKAASRLDEAERAFRQAQDLASKLAAQYPEVAECRLQLAHSHNGLGHTLWNKQQAQAGEKECRAAVELFGKLAVDFPSTAEYRTHVANCNAQLGGFFARNNHHREAEVAYSSAVDAFGRLAADFPSQPSYRAEIAWNQNAIGKSCRKLASFLARQPNQGSEAEKAHRRDVGAFEKLSVEFRDNSAWPEQLAHGHRQWAFDLWQTGRPKEGNKSFREAIAVLEKSAVEFPDAEPSHHELLSDTYRVLVRLLATTGDAQESEQTIREIIKVSERHAAEKPSEHTFRRVVGLAHNALGSMFKTQVRIPEAEQACVLAVEVLGTLTKDFPDVTLYQDDLILSHCELGDLLQSVGRQPEAQMAYTRAIGLTPTAHAVWFRRAAALGAMGQWEQAAGDISKIVQADPKNAVGHNNLAWLLVTCPEARLRDPARAVALARKALELAPTEVGHWNTLGVAQYRAGDWQAAIDALTKSMELRTGGDSFDWYFLAMAHWQLDHKEEARKWFDQAVAWMGKNQPQNEELLRFRTETAELLGIQEPSNKAEEK